MKLLKKIKQIFSKRFIIVVGNVYVVTEKETINDIPIKNEVEIREVN